MIKRVFILLFVFCASAQAQWSTNWTTHAAITNWPSTGYTYHVWQNRSWYEQCTNAIDEKYRAVFGDNYFTNSTWSNPAYSYLVSNAYFLATSTNWFTFTNAPYFFSRRVKYIIDGHVRIIPYNLGFAPSGTYDQVLSAMALTTNQVDQPFSMVENSVYLSVDAFVTNSIAVHANLPTNYFNSSLGESPPWFESGFPMYRYTNSYSTNYTTVATNQYTYYPFALGAFAGWPQARWALDSMVDFTDSASGYMRVQARLFEGVGNGSSDSSWTAAKSAADSDYAITTNLVWSDVGGDKFDIYTSGYFNRTNISPLGGIFNAEKHGYIMEIRLNGLAITTARQAVVFRSTIYDHLDPSPSYGDAGTGYTQSLWQVLINTNGTNNISATLDVSNPDWCDIPTVGDSLGDGPENSLGMTLRNFLGMVDFGQQLKYKE